MKLVRWMLAACLSAGLGAPAPAAAQQKATAGKPGEASGKDKAHAYLRSGARAANAGQWDDAYAELSIAWKLHQDWEIAAALGRAAHRTQHHAEAVRRLSYFLREAPKDRVSAKQRADAEGLLREARAKTGSLTFTAAPGSEITVDGEVVGTAPLPEPLVVDPGKHTVESRLGATLESKTTDVVAGSSGSVAFTLPKVAEPPLAMKPVEAADKGAQKQAAAKDPDGRAAAQSMAQAEADARNVALWSLVGGGLAAAGTTVFFFASRPAAGSPVQGAVGISPAGPSLWIHGQF